MNLLDKIDISGRQYWFVRTHFGTDFETFFTNRFIGIEWDYISKQDLIDAETNQERIKAVIAREENLDPTNTIDKIKISTIYGKLIRFRDLKKDDVIIIPTARSEELAFGRIADTSITTDVIDSSYPYTKKRRVIWEKRAPLDLLDPTFYQVKKNMHGLSNVNSFRFYIDSVMKPMFIYDDDEKIYLNFDITRNTGIPGGDYFGFGHKFISLLNSLNRAAFADENILDLEVRMNLNSPGKSAFITTAKKTLLALILVMSSPDDIRTENLRDTFTTEQIVSIEQFVQDNRDAIDSLQGYVEDLEITTLNQVNSLFENPNEDVEPIAE